MNARRKRLTAVVVILLLLFAGWLFFLKTESEESAVPELTTEKPVESAAEPLGAIPAGARKPNAIKDALRNSKWKILSRNGEAVESSSPSPGTGIQLTLEFVRADFDGAGMRGVRKFAAFSPPQYAAIKEALLKRKSTEISEAPPEVGASGTTIGFDLQNATDQHEFTIDFTPTIGDDGASLRLETETRGTKIRRDGNLPIWDGQTVMIDLGPAAGDTRFRRLAAFVTVRLVDANGEPVHAFEWNP